LEVHVKRLGETIEKDEKELEREEKEQKKHITSDDLHEGFENKVRALL
jgi:cell division cycle protein 37